MDSVNFANIEEEIAGRLNQDIEQEQVISADSPLALVSGNYFKVVCCFGQRKIFLLKYFQQKFSSEGRDSSLDFINLPRGRRLVPVPSLAWTGTFNAGYDEDLGATAVELPYRGGDLSLILLLPGKISEFITGRVKLVRDYIRAIFLIQPH